MIQSQKEVLTEIIEKQHETQRDLIKYEMEKQRLYDKDIMDKERTFQKEQMQSFLQTMQAICSPPSLNYGMPTQNFVMPMRPQNIKIIPV